MMYSRYRLTLAALAALIILLVWLFLEKSPYGAIIKAGASDAEMVMALGKNLPCMRTFVFAIGSVLAGLIVGLSTSLSVMVWARVPDIVPFVILTIVLLFRPRGLMGEKSVLEM